MIGKSFGIFKESPSGVRRRKWVKYFFIEGETPAVMPNGLKETHLRFRESLE